MFPFPVYASGHMTKRGGSHVEWLTVGESPIAVKYFVVCREYATLVMLRRSHWGISTMALKKVKGTLERVLDKNLQDLVRGIRNHKENEVNLLTSFRIHTICHTWLCCTSLIMAGIICMLEIMTVPVVHVLCCKPG